MKTAIILAYTTTRCEYDYVQNYDQCLNGGVSVQRKVISTIPEPYCAPAYRD